MRSLRWFSWVVPFAVLLVASAAWATRPSKRLGDEARGEQLYTRHCVQCHGVSGAGDGPAAAALVAKVPDLRGEVTGKNREAHAQIVLDGKGVMPGFEASFDRYDARRVLRHMEKVGRAAEGEVPVDGDPADTDLPLPADTDGSLPRDTDRPLPAGTAGK